MWVADGIIAGLIAGMFMGVFSQLGYRLGIVRSHLIVIDGAFALSIMKQDGRIVAIYTAGTIIHLVTSIVFGVIYVAISKVADFNVGQVVPLIVYVFVLWLAMLAIALPVAGQGFMGNKIRGTVWLEQLVLHFIFGLGFWWALKIF
jgi:hypothetical protein